MGRRTRPYLPGGVFHLTARTLRREHRFTPPLRTAALNAMGSTVERSRMRLLAVAVMSNHLHIVVQQGDRPLAALMQPLLRRMALRVQDTHSLDGPVFWRPYASQPCLDPSHVRNAIVYTHLNPVRAGLCDDPAGYRWTSHPLYLGVSASDLPPEIEPLEPVLDPTLALPLFAADRARSATQLHDDYRAFTNWRQEADRAQYDEDAEEVEPPSPPPSPWGDPAWGTSLSPLFHAPVRPKMAAFDRDVRPRRPGPDLATLANRTLAAEDSGVSMDAIRGRRGGARAVRLRHVIIRRLHVAGYRNVDIARFIGLSESGVSYVLCKRHHER